jgi:hypothetical protein
MNKQKQLEILQKWIGKQFIKRSFTIQEVVETKDPFTGNIHTNIVEKRIRYAVPPSFKDGDQRIWYITLPNRFTIPLIKHNSATSAAKRKIIGFIKPPIYAKTRPNVVSTCFV